MKIKNILSLILLLIPSLILSSKADEITDTMRNYCVIPPFMEVNTKPNILLVMDYSGSMQLSSNFGCNYITLRELIPLYGGKARLNYVPVPICGGDPDKYYAYDDDNDTWYYSDDGKTYYSNGDVPPFYRSINYDKNKTYYGYFKSNVYYKYNSSEGYWEENQNCNVSDENASIGNGIDCVSGNLLNWISMTRVDVALKALTGGKAHSCGSSNNDLCLVPRGSVRRVLDDSLKCEFWVVPNKLWDSTSQYNDPNYDLRITIKNYNGTCPIGEISRAWLRVKINKDEKVGILQRNKDIGNYALMVFSNSGIDEFNRKGEIRYGFNEYINNGMDDLVSKMDNELPIGGTPTGEALYEAYDYLKQSNEHSYEKNSDYIDRDSSKDPFYDNKLSKLIPCKNNVIILISDGQWNGDVDPDGVAKLLHTNDIRSDLDGEQTALIFSLYIFSTGKSGKKSMKTIAAAGTFTDLDGNGKPYNIPLSNDSKEITYPRPKCNPNGTYEDKCKEWDKNRDGIPDGYFYASNGEALENAMNTIFTAIKKYSYSGGAVAVLGERSEEHSATGVVLKGSVLAQSLFYTQKYGVDWVGKVYGYWYDLIDSTIREDTNTNKILEPTIDKIIEFSLENEKTLVINRYNVNSIDGSKSTLDVKLYDPDELNYLFETGYNLWAYYNESNTDTADDRKIYFAACEKGEDCLKEFKYTSLSDFMLSKSYESNIFRIPLLGFPASCFNMCNYFDEMSSFDFITMWNKFLDCLNNNNDYDKLIKYIRGKDYAGWRNRTTGDKVWKLGDIIHSSPQIVHYKDKNVIIVGANDGMLHVFKLGKTTEKGINKANQLVKLEGENIGEELWAFIPLNMLPYLRFLADPNYCHTYYVDSSVYVFDTKDGRKILIGSMRLGGGTGDTTTSSNEKYKPVNPPKWACPTTLWDFIKEQCKQCASGFMGFDFMCSWIPSSPPDFSHCIGLSSYFAIDITDIDNPKFLWEFSHPDLGFTYSGPAIIQKKVDDEYKYYVIFGSGPTNYYGNSNQELKYFVIKLDGSNVNSPYVISTNIRNAFSGRLFKKGFDLNNDGNTDYVFVGYARRDGNMNNWKGGLLQIDVRDKNPFNWTVEKYFTDAQEPVTAKVELGKCFNKYYLYFGTGRWFYKADNPLPGQRGRLYGVPLDCDIKKVECSPNINVAHSSRDVCTDAKNKVIRSWYIELDLGNNNYFKERDITDPSLTNLNVVLFTTIEPTKDPCKFGGRTRIWALNCATGGAILDKCPVYRIDIRKLKGNLLLQLSGGNIQQINLKQLAKEEEKNNSRTSKWFTGTAPEGSPSFVMPAIPSKGEILLWLEK